MPPRAPAGRPGEILARRALEALPAAREQVLAGRPRESLDPQGLAARPGEILEPRAVLATRPGEIREPREARPARPGEIREQEAWPALPAAPAVRRTQDRPRAI
jgi:hypothetical protein